MRSTFKSILLPVILGILIFGFWISPDFQEIAAGVAIFLFGMLMLEDGFKLFSGGYLERVLEKATRSTARALSFGVVSTTIMQSSSLVSVITISFLSAGLISLAAGVGIIFGANIGTTTGAWLVAGFGLKVKISAYAMPMLALSIILVFQKSKYLRGIGYVLGGLGFLFLGIHYMKEGFETFKDQFDLTRFAMTGIVGLIVYTLVGAAATVVMQSSHATLVLIITALAAQQISYENALALAIGANIGTTITAIIGSMTSNFQGKRLALAHLIFNLVTAGVALILIAPIRDAVDWVSAGVGIREDDYALKLAVFHTIFNSMGVLLMLPVMQPLLRFLERTITEKTPDVSKPRYLDKTVDDFPATIVAALRNEVAHLHENALELIAHGMNLHRHDLYEAADVQKYVESQRRPFDYDMERAYEQRVKVLYVAIVEFVTRVLSTDLPEETIDHVQRLRESAERMVRAVKEVKHMRGNASHYTSADYGGATEAYNYLRTEIARILVELNKMSESNPEHRTALWLEGERSRVKGEKKMIANIVEGLIRDGVIDALTGTSLMNDSNYAYRAMKEMLESARIYYSEIEGPMTEVERLLSIEEADSRHGPPTVETPAVALEPALRRPE
jgi:phosphate:Na+ symporter